MAKRTHSKEHRPLRGVEPELVTKRLKMLLYGGRGERKTTTAISFPRPYVIDTERGAENEQYVRIIKDRGGRLLQTSDGSEVIDEILALLTNEHPYQTLVIDPITIVWDDLLDKYIDEYGDNFSRHKGPAKRDIKHMMNLIYRLDMNVIMTAHGKPKWVRSTDAKGKEVVTQEGLAPSANEELEYAFDLVIETQPRGNDVYGVVRKTRFAQFKTGEAFSLDYDSIADRYGRDALERNSKPVELASEEQVKKLEALFEACGVTIDKVNKFVTRHKAENLSEVPAESVQKAIEHYESIAENLKKGANE